MVWSWTSPVSSSEMRMQAVSPLLFLLLGPWARGQGQCPSPRECIQQERCPGFTSQWQELKALAYGSEEHDALQEKLHGDVCDKENRKVCCDPVNLEISGGDGYTEPHQYPFMVRITVVVRSN